MAIKFLLTFSSPGYIVSNPNSFCLFSQGLFLKRSPLSHTPWNQFQVFPISIHYHHPPGVPAHACGPCSNLYMQESSCGPTPRTSWASKSCSFNSSLGLHHLPILLGWFSWSKCQSSEQLITGTDGAHSKCSTKNDNDQLKMLQGTHSSTCLLLVRII